jgi:hypothetical protein
VRRVPASELLRLPVRLHGIEIGHAVDALVDPVQNRVLGFDVLCRDDSHRFLPLTAVTLEPKQIWVGSALMLLEEDQFDFYRKRARRLRELVPGLQDAWVSADGTLELVISNDAA